MMRSARRFGIVLVAWFAMTTSAFAKPAALVDAAPTAVAPAVTDYRPSLLVTDVVLSGPLAAPCAHVGRSIQLLLREAFATAGYRIVLDASIPADFTLRTEVMTVSNKGDPATITIERKGELIASVSDEIDIGTSDCSNDKTSVANLAGRLAHSSALSVATQTLKASSLKPDTPAPPVATPADPRPTAAVVLAVFDIQTAQANVKREMLDQLTDYLAAKLTEVGGFRVIPREQLRQRLAQEKTAGFKACYDESCQIESGKAVSAEKSLATKLLRVGNKCALTSQVYDLRTETAEKAASARTDCSDDALMDAMDSLAKQLAAPASK